MKRLIAFLLIAAVANPAHAFWGIGDVTFDPTSYGEIVKQYEQMVKMYETAKSQLDSLAKIEQTIKEAQQAYDTLASGDIKNVVAGMKLDTNNTKTAAGLRAELANMENHGTQSVSYVNYQLSMIGQLENLAALQKASSNNMQQSTGNPLLRWAQPRNCAASRMIIRNRKPQRRLWTTCKTLQNFMERLLNEQSGRIAHQLQYGSVV
jgi:hypothetical protein